MTICIKDQISKEETTINNVVRIRTENGRLIIMYYDLIYKETMMIVPLKDIIIVLCE